VSQAFPASIELSIEEPAFHRDMISLLSQSCLSYLSVFVSPAELTVGWGGGAKSQRRRESLVFYKSFSTLWAFPIKS
jgi:hypothetical protein